LPTAHPTALEDILLNERSPVASILLPCACAVAACAEAAAPGDDSSSEVRLIFGCLPGITSGVDNVDSRVSTGGQLLYILHGASSNQFHLLLGGGLFEDVRRGSVAGADSLVTDDAHGVVLTGGASYQVNQPLSLAARVNLKGGIGRVTSTESFSQGDFQTIGKDGSYSDASLAVGGWRTFPVKIMVVGEVGLDSFRGTSDLPGAAIEARGNGVFLRGGVGYSF